MLTIYKASAGSGKTFQLALHYLKMVLGVKDNPDGRWRLNPQLLTDKPSQVHRHILAITFTNKATDEMTKRIVASLNEVSHAANPDSHPYITMLMEEFGCSFEDLRSASSRALISLLIDFGNFHVSTIDSFFQTVLRTFARELGIQGDYNIEISPEDPIRLAVNLLFNDLDSPNKHNDPKLQRLYRWMEERAAEAQGKYTPYKRASKDFKALVLMVNKIFAEDFKPLQQDLRDYLDDPERLDKFTHSLDETIKSYTAIMTDAAQKALGLVNSFVETGLIKKSTLGLLEDFASGIFDCRQKKLLERVLNGETDCDLFTLNKSKSKKIDDSQSLAYVTAMNDFAEAIQTHYPVYRLALVLKKTIPQLEFLRVMFDYLDKARREGNFLILDDTASHISRVIGHTEVPFIYEHMGSHLRHFLIDEFQDTSRLQWENLLPLVTNSHDEGHDSLIIGDVKQAIYRFRNSDPSILGHDLEHVDFPDSSRVTLRGDSESDNRNHRTAHGIVKFNNTIMPLFAQRALQTEYPEGYSGTQVQQACSDNKAHLPSRIEFIPYVTGSYRSKCVKYDDEGHPVPFNPSGVLLAQPVITDNDSLVNVIIDRILKQVNERHYRWKDIAILYRSKVHVRTLIKEMVRRQIPLLSSDSLYLNNASSVKLLVSLLTMLANTTVAPLRKDRDGDKSQNEEVQQSASTAHTVFETRYNYFVNNSGLGLTPQQAIDRALSSDNEVEESEVPSSKVYDTLRKILARHPATLVATVEAILAEGLIPTKTIEDEKNYMSAFIDLVLDYGERIDNDINGFLQWWDDHKGSATVTAPPDSDAVKIMTIHSAKGLEFKCVHLVDFSWKLVDTRDDVWLDIRPGNSFGIQSRLPLDSDLIPPMMHFSLSTSGLQYPGSPFNAYMEEQKKLMRVDALNLAYVGLTRAQTELTVYYDTMTSNTVGAAMADTLTAVTKEQPDSADRFRLAIPDGCFNKETKALLLEIAPSAPLTDKVLARQQCETEEQKAQEVANKKLSDRLTARYISVVRADLKTLVNVEALDRRSDEIIDDVDDEMANDGIKSVDEKEELFRLRSRLKNEKTQRGLDLHEILRHIPHYEEGDDLEAIIGQAIEKASASDSFNASAATEYSDLLRKMLTEPAATRWFSPSARVDTEISYHEPWKEGDERDDYRLGRMHRIDRMVEYPDGSVDIVDYKFSANKLPEYVVQVREYVNAVSRILPGRRVRGYLWYVDLGNVDPV